MKVESHVRVAGIDDQIVEDLDVLRVTWKLAEDGRGGEEPRYPVPGDDDVAQGHVFDVRRVFAVSSKEHARDDGVRDRIVGNRDVFGDAGDVSTMVMALSLTKSSVLFVMYMCRPRPLPPALMRPPPDSSLRSTTSPSTRTTRM